MKTVKTVKDIRNDLIAKYQNKDFVIDKTGQKLVEIIGATFIADEDIIFGKLNLDYAKREVEWYESQSLNVYDIPGKVPEIWKMVADKDGNINSNYGWIIYSKENGEQYKHCIRTLKRDKDSRRAMMIYTRPSIQWEYNKNGMSDFICTNTVQLLIRNDKLYYILNQRSCDSIFGYKNDIYWANYVFDKALKELQRTYPELQKGNIIHQIGSLHIYERHFYILDNYVKENTQWKLLYILQNITKQD